MTVTERQKDIAVKRGCVEFGRQLVDDIGTGSASDDAAWVFGYSSLEANLGRQGVHLKQPLHGRG